MSADHREEVPEITPQVVHLGDLLKWAREGRLLVPEFQRAFVWRRQDILDLFDSISRQYPMGTLFLWGADTLPKHRNHIGPLRVPAYKGQQWLVLDGQQRLTTLVSVLLRDDPNWEEQLDTEDPARWRVYFDAATDGGFIHLPRDEAPKPSLIEAPALLETLKLIRAGQHIVSQASREEADQWITRAQAVAQAIQSYRVPLVFFKTNDLNVAVESFSRLNKKGRAIGRDEMFSALTYEEGHERPFHLALEIDRLQLAMVQSGFGKVDRTILLRAVLTAANLDMYRTDWSRLGRHLQTETKTRLPQAVAEARAGLEKARTFLRHLGFYNVRMLPYSMQLVALSAFFGRCAEPTQAQKSLLERWFWSSSFAGWFGTGNPSRVRRLVEEFRDGLPAQAKPDLRHMHLDQAALPTPARFDLRSARVRVLLCVLFQRGLLRPDGRKLELQEASRLLSEKGPAAMSVICWTGASRELSVSPANRILDLGPNGSRQAKSWLLELHNDRKSDVLESHAILPQAAEALSEGDYDTFLRLRLERLGQIERDFMQKVGVTPPASTDAGPIIYDSDAELEYDWTDYDPGDPPDFGYLHFEPYEFAAAEEGSEDLP